MNQTYYQGKDAYEDLANAIIYTAIVDYEKAYKCLRRINKKRKKLIDESQKYPDVFCTVNEFKKNNRQYKNSSNDIVSTLESINKVKQIRAKFTLLSATEANAVKTIRECERFFLGSWIRELSRVDGKLIKRRIDEKLIKKGFELLEQTEREENYGWD